MKNPILAFVIAVTAFAAPHAALAQAVPSEPLDRIVAVVDEDVVLQSELDRQVSRVTTQYANSPQQLPPRDVLEHQVLERLILQKLQVTRADSSGVKVSDAEIDQALTGLAAQNKMDLSQLRGAIQARRAGRTASSPARRAEPRAGQRRRSRHGHPERLDA